MIQVVKMTDREKMKMYMKLSKKELAKMLINCNTLIEHHLTKIEILPTGDSTGDYIPPYTYITSIQP